MFDVTVNTKNTEAAKILVTKLIESGVGFTYSFDGDTATEQVQAYGITQECMNDKFNDSVDEAAFDSYEATHEGS